MEYQDDWSSGRHPAVKRTQYLPAINLCVNGDRIRDYFGGSRQLQKFSVTWTSDSWLESVFKVEKFAFNRRLAPFLGV